MEGRKEIQKEKINQNSRKLKKTNSWFLGKIDQVNRKKTQITSFG